MEQHDSRVVMAVRDNLKKLILKYDIKVGQEDVRAIVDTGAQVSLMSRKMAQKLKITMNQHQGGAIKGVNGNALTIDGKACVRIKTSISCKPINIYNTRYRVPIDFGATLDMWSIQLLYTVMIYQSSFPGGETLGLCAQGLNCNDCIKDFAMGVMPSHH